MICRATTSERLLLQILGQPGESEQSETPEEPYTPEQLEKGRRMMARIQQAAVLAAARLREKEALERLAALPPATRFIN
jgi:hypothetical protein